MQPSIFLVVYKSEEPAKQSGRFKTPKTDGTCLEDATLKM